MRTKVAWRRRAVGGWISTDGLWTLREWQKGMWWLYRGQSRYTPTGHYDDAVWFGSSGEAKRYVRDLPPEPTQVCPCCLGRRRIQTRQPLAGLYRDCARCHATGRVFDLSDSEIRSTVHSLRDKGLSLELRNIALCLASRRRIPFSVDFEKRVYAQLKSLVRSGDLRRARFLPGRPCYQPG